MLPTQHWTSAGAFHQLIIKVMMSPPAEEEKK